MTWRSYCRAVGFLGLCLLLNLVMVSVMADDPVSYKKGDEVAVFANIVGPMYNPTETYRYYDLPFCPPEEMISDEHALGELLTGSRKVKSRYHLRYLIPKELDSLCQKQLSEEELEKFADALRRQFYFELFVDELPLRAPLGVADRNLIQFLGKKKKNEKLEIYTHLNFHIGYNQDKVVFANVSSDPGRTYLLSKENLKNSIDFTYSVMWSPSELQWEDRMVAYNQGRLIASNSEIRWLSVVNAFILVMLLTLFLAVIMVRILKNDFARYMDRTDDDLDKDESGWKLVHGDVFRMPPNLNLFAAMIGTGAQLFFLVLALIFLAILDAFNPTQRGGAMTAAIVVYALSAGIGGYTSAKYYKQLGGTNWVANILTCAVIFPGPLLLTFSFLNSVAIYYESTAALPFGTIMIVLALYVLVACPLTVIGGIAGRNMAAPFDAPCRTNKIPREIPEQTSYRHPLVQILIAGSLPFSAIYIEMHHILTALWGNQFYTLFGILLLSFIMLTVATAFVTVTLTYFQLNMEDHRWWWRSFVTGGISGLWVYMYSIWYYKTATNMSGFLQSSYYFGYMAILSFGIFLMLGFIGFVSSLAFVKKIYRTIKVE